MLPPICNRGETSLLFYVVRRRFGSRPPAQRGRQDRWEPVFGDPLPSAQLSSCDHPRSVRLFVGMILLHEDPSKDFAFIVYVHPANNHYCIKLIIRHAKRVYRGRQPVQLEISCLSRLMKIKKIKNLNPDWAWIWTSRHRRHPCTTPPRPHEPSPSNVAPPRQIRCPPRRIRQCWRCSAFVSSLCSSPSDLDTLHAPPSEEREEGEGTSSDPWTVREGRHHRKGTPLRHRR